MQQLKLSDIIKAFWQWLQFFGHSWKLNLSILTIALIIGSAYFVFQDHRYEAKVSFIIEEGGGGIPSGISGLASSLGVNLGGLGGSDNLLSGDNFSEIIRSRTLVEKVLFSPLDPMKGENQPTLIQLYLASSGLEKKWKKNLEAFEPGIFGPSQKGQTPSILRDSLVSLVYEKMLKNNLVLDRQSKQGSIWFLSIQSEDPQFSALFAERLVTAAGKWYMDLKTRMAKENTAQFQKRADSLHSLLSRQSFYAASQQILNPNEAFKTAAVPGELSQREKQIQQTLYAEVVKNLEFSRMALNNLTPVIHVLDRPVLPLKDRQQPWYEILIGALGTSLIISLLLAFFRFPVQD